MRKINRTRKRVLKRIRHKMFVEALTKRIAEMILDKMYERIIFGNDLSYGEILKEIMEVEHGKRD